MIIYIYIYTNVYPHTNYALLRHSKLGLSLPFLALPPKMTNMSFTIFVIADTVAVTSVRMTVRAVKSNLNRITNAANRTTIVAPCSQGPCIHTGREDPTRVEAVSFVLHPQAMVRLLSEVICIRVRGTGVLINIMEVNWVRFARRCLAFIKAATYNSLDLPDARRD